MTRRLNQLALIAGVIASVGCNRSVAGPAPSTSSSAPTVYATPPLRGVIRETNGGPIANAMVGLTTTVGTYIRSPRVASDATGTVVIPSLTELCPGPGRVVVETFSRDFVFGQGPAFACTSASNPQEVAFEVKGQRILNAASGAPVVFTLSNDDINWVTDETGYSCGPCRIVELGQLPLGRTAVLRVEWSGPNPIHLWIEGFRFYDSERLREVVAAPGQTATTLTIPVEWRPLYLELKVGLPFGGRFPDGSPPVSVRIVLES